MLEMFVIQHTSTEPNFILIVLSIQKNKAEVWLPLPSNAYDDVTNFEICRTHKITKIVISTERNIIFCSNKKVINYDSTLRATLWQKNNFVTEVTFMGLSIFPASSYILDILQHILRTSRSGKIALWNS